MLGVGTALESGDWWKTFLTYFWDWDCVGACSFPGLKGRDCVHEDWDLVGQLGTPLCAVSDGPLRHLGLVVAWNPL